MGMVAAGTALCVPGNHEAQAAARSCAGARCRSPTAWPRPWRSWRAARSPGSRAFLDGLISHYVLDGGRLVVAHAGLKEAYQGRASGRVRAFALYGDTTGETDEYGLPVRYPWARDYRGRRHGRLRPHARPPTPEWINNTICLDTGCVFGGALTALRYPERELVVGAGRSGSTTRRPARCAPAAPRARRGPRPGRRHRPPAPRHRLRPDHRARRARGRRAGGDEPVRGRPALAAVAAADHGAVLDLDRRRLPGAPGAGARRPAHAGRRPGGVRGEAHGLARGGAGLPDRPSRRTVRRRRHHRRIYTRTGRPFFDAARTEQLLAAVRAAVAAAGLWDELDTDWLLLDTELLPWSAKARRADPEQYAAVGAAGRAALPAALAVLDEAAARGLDVGRRCATGSAAALREIARPTPTPTGPMSPTDGRR